MDRLRSFFFYRLRSFASLANITLPPVITSAFSYPSQHHFRPRIQCGMEYYTQKHTKQVLTRTFALKVAALYISCSGAR